MTKPTDLTRWATAGGADVTEPASGTKDSGYLDAAQPDAGELNWILNRTYLWEVWLNAFESTAHTWTAFQAFNSGIGITGGFETDTLIVDGSAEFDSTVAFLGVATFTGAPVFNAVATFAANAVFATADFHGNTHLIDVTKTFTCDQLSIFNGAATFNGGSAFVGAVDAHAAVTFFTSAPVSVNGTFGFGGSAHVITAIPFLMTTPAKTAALSNTINPLNTIKAWANWTHNNTAAPAYNDGCNIASVVESTVGGESRIQITFSSPMADTNYQIKPNYEGGVVPATLGYVPIADVVAGTKLTTGFMLRFLQSSSATAAYCTPAGQNGITFDVQVCGRQ